MMYALACLSGFIVTGCLVRILIKPARLMGWVDRPSIRKKHLSPTPMIGGLAVWAGFSVGSIQLCETGDYCQMLIGLAAVMLIGLYDDYRPMPAVSRLIWQGAVALALVMTSDTQLTSLGDLLGVGVVQGEWITWCLTPLAIIGMINAFNMIDGLDGLAAGLAWVASGLLLLMSLSAAQPAGELTGLLGVMLGALTGFLAFNLRYPGHSRASVFLGDAGSTLLGFLMAWFLIHSSQSPSPVLDPVTALWLVALPLMDTVALMIRRHRQGRSPLAADRQHLHHLLLAEGFPVERVVLMMLFISACLGAIGWLLQWAGVAESVRFYLFLAMFVIYYRVTRRMSKGPLVSGEPLMSRRLS